MNNDVAIEVLDDVDRERFIMVYDDVWHALANTTALTVYMALMRRVNSGRKEWFGTHRELAKEAGGRKGMSATTFKRGVAHLEGLGLVRVIHRFVPANWDRKDASAIANGRDEGHPVQIGNLYQIRFHLPQGTCANTPPPSNSGGTPPSNIGGTPPSNSGGTPPSKFDLLTEDTHDIDTHDIDTRTPSAANAAQPPTGELALIGESEAGKELARTGDKAPKATKGTRLDPEWFPDQIVIQKMQAEFPDMDMARVHEEFVDYWISTTRNALKRDWNAAWRNWIRSTAKRGNYPRIMTTARPQVSKADEKVMWYMQRGEELARQYENRE